MELKKGYTFYHEELIDGLEKEIVCSGKYLGEDEGFMFFKCKHGIKISKEVHDKINPNSTIENFMKFIKQKFEIKLDREVSVWEDDFEINIFIPRNKLNGFFKLGIIEEIMDDILEDWCSVQWCELKNNNINCDSVSVLVSFRVRDVYEEEFRFNRENQ